MYYFEKYVPQAMKSTKCDSFQWKWTVAVNKSTMCRINMYLKFSQKQ